MKALSIQQPWASIIAYGIKDVENRTWDTPYRGKFLIHASSKRVPKDFEYGLPMEWGNEIINHIFFGNLPKLQDLPTSAIIGYVELEGIVNDSESIWASPELLHWKLKNAYVFDTPITDVKGKLNLFDYPEIDENHLPPAHKVEIRRPQLNGTSLTIPVSDSFCSDMLGNCNIDGLTLEISSDYDSLFDKDDNMKKITDITVVGPTKTLKAKVKKHYIWSPYDEEGNPIRVISFMSNAEDYCVDLQQIRLELER